MSDVSRPKIDDAPFPEPGIGWVELDGCFEHPEWGIRIFRIMLGSIEAWFRRDAREDIGGPLPQLHRGAGTFERHNQFLRRETEKWHPTDADRIYDMNPAIEWKYWVSDNKYVISRNDVKIWRIAIQKQRPFFVLSRDEKMEIGYLSFSESDAQAGAYYLSQYGSTGTSA